MPEKSHSLSCSWTWLWDDMHAVSGVRSISPAAPQGKASVFEIMAAEAQGKAVFLSLTLHHRQRTRGLAVQLSHVRYRVGLCRGLGNLPDEQGARSVSGATRGGFALPRSACLSLPGATRLHCNGDAAGPKNLQGMSDSDNALRNLNGPAE